MTEEAVEIATAIPYHADKDRFLLAKRTGETDIQPGKWDFPGGSIEDEKPRKAAVRELREETGLVGKAIRSGDPFIVDNEDGRFNVHPVLVLVDEEPELNPEHTDYEWIKTRDLEKFETVEGLKEDLERVGVLE